jgi:DNA (cytosine-5)-methyltransferase 1
MGYHRAGFDVVGVDHVRQPRYPFSFAQADALEYLAAHGREFDAIHASPPCQKYSKTQCIRGNEHPDLIAQTRELLIAAGRPFVIENVVGAPLINPILLTGGMFGLRTNRLRLFEFHGFDVPFFLQPPPAGQARMGRPPRWDGDFVQAVGNFAAKTYTARAMGIDWMTRAELAQAIPPVYTEFICRYLLQAIGVHA